MPRIEANARISFYDHANQAVLDRVLNVESQNDEGIEEEKTRDTVASVEEMLEGYEWASGDMSGRLRGRGAADQIEANLLDELMALEKVCYR
jgi:exocyst complex component 1